MSSKLKLIDVNGNDSKPNEEILTKELFLFLCCQALKHLPEYQYVWMLIMVFAFIKCVLFGNIKIRTYMKYVYHLHFFNPTGTRLGVSGVTANFISRVQALNLIPDLFYVASVHTVSYSFVFFWSN